ncbi:MAG: gamma-glutamyl-gamma-aminobutyrate hydrolase family protein [Clostridiales bacterium]|nr:gamma-glutamyl-gamma-aminobutyrate hydrolase family protein [Clostridiales bacterium]
MYGAKAVIGVMPLWDEEKESIWMLPGYMRSLEEQGAVTMMLPLTDQEGILDYFLSLCDGFLFTGGQDVSPALYQEEKSEKCGETCGLRDRMEQYILRKAIEADKAVLGICRGIQLMNVALGGTLYQDLPSEISSPIEHHMRAPYDREAHKVRIVKGSPLEAVVNHNIIAVNSYHHQAIKRLAEPLRAMAYAEDQIVEAVYMPSQRFIWGIQWHPEFSYQVSKESRSILKAFLSAAAWEENEEYRS